MTLADRDLTAEPLVPLPHSRTTLAGQLRETGHGNERILQIYQQVFGMNRVQAAELLCGTQAGGQPTLFST